jgi:F0F1-type ATP synthase membrane subunit b/b'
MPNNKQLNGTAKKVTMTALGTLLTGLLMAWVVWASSGITENKTKVATVTEKACTTEKKVEQVKEDAKKEREEIKAKLDKIYDLLIAQNKK